MKAADYHNLDGGSVWYQRVAAEVEQNRYGLKAAQEKKYKLELLLRVARRVDGFSQTCGECRAFKDDITRLVKELGLRLQMPSKEGLKGHAQAVNTMVGHLKKAHKMVDKNYYIGIGISIGMAAGAALGGLFSEVFGSPVIGTPLGVVLGLAVGAYLDRKARREDRVI